MNSKLYIKNVDFGRPFKFTIWFNTEVSVYCFWYLIHFDVHFFQKLYSQLTVWVYELKNDEEFADSTNHFWSRWISKLLFSHGCSSSWRIILSFNNFIFLLKKRFEWSLQILVNTFKKNFIEYIFEYSDEKRNFPNKK